METRADYNKEVLGITLNGSSAMETTTEVVERGKFLFYANVDDFEQNKDFVGKILGAIQQNDGIVITDLADIKKLNPLEVFSFGEAVEFLGIRIHSFPSFTDISKDMSQKTKLWSELKKRV